MASADQISCRNLGRQSGRRPLRKVYRSPGHRPLRVRHRRCAATPGGAGRSPPPTGTAEVLSGGAEAIPQSPVGRQLPLHKGAFPCGGRGDRTGDADCRVASLLAMTVLIIPRRPNGPTWESVLFYDGRGFGPPYERRRERHAEVVGPYGKERKPNQPPKPAGAQRSVRARVGEGWAGIGAKAIPKGGPPPRPPRQRLAKRKARG